MPSRKRLTDRVIIITGASSGIGAATAVECAHAGMDVVLNARRPDRLDQVAERVRTIGRRAVCVPACVTDPDLPERLLDAAQGEYGRFDAVFANAGYGATLSMLDMSDADLRTMFDVNFFSAVSLLRLAATRMIAENRCGHLLMCASCLAKFSLPLHGHYSATKAAQNQVCWSMRAELASHGIEVSSVLPITTTTEFFEQSALRSGLQPSNTPAPDHSPRLFIQPPERVARAIVRCLRRPTPEVWTSHIVRLTAGVMTMFPGFADWIMRHEMNRELQKERRT